MRCNCGATNFAYDGVFVCLSCNQPIAGQTKQVEKLKPKYFKFGTLGCACETPHYRERLHKRHSNFDWRTLKDMYNKLLGLKLPHDIIHAVEHEDYYIYFKIDYHSVRRRTELSLISITPNNVLESDNDKPVTLVVI